MRTQCMVQEVEYLIGEKRKFVKEPCYTQGTGSWHIHNKLKNTLLYFKAVGLYNIFCKFLLLNPEDKVL